MMSPAMRVFWQRYGLTAMLGVAAVGFLGAIGFETGWGQAVRPPLPTANDAPRTADMLATLPAFAMPALDISFKETADRPMFTPTRRPAAVNLAGNVPAMKKGQFKLSGTSVSNDLTVAFLREAATGKTVRVTRGKEVNGMILDLVEANRVVLKQGEETEELTLRTAASPPAPPKVETPAPVATPAGAPPLAAVSVGAAPAPATRPAPVPQNPLVPAPGSSQLPGFVLPGAALPTPAQAVPSAESSTAAQRRRRFQTTSPQ
jgi:hypothetical protein